MYSLNHWMLLTVAMVACMPQAHGDDGPGNPPIMMTPVQRNVAYGPHQRLLGGSATNLDVYRPAGEAVVPVVIWIHGGAWKIGSKQGVDLKPKFFSGQGYAFISINYRLVPEVDVATQAGDVAQAIVWVKQHAAELNMDPARIILMGHSAGAHLAALVATDGQYLQAAGGTLQDIQGVILLDGAGYDVVRQLQEAVLPQVKEIYTGAFGTDAAQQRKLSPITHVAKDQGIPPFLVLYCARRADSKSQSVALAEKLNAAGSAAKAVGYADKTHMTINRELGADRDLPTAEVIQFLKRLSATVPTPGQ